MLIFIAAKAGSSSLPKKERQAWPPFPPIRVGGNSRGGAVASSSAHYSRPASIL
jgi:hypothetical protein